MVAITAAISPYAAVRDEMRAATQADGARFVEVHVHAPLATRAERDVKGLYKKALAGEIENFTGVSDPYEPPANPEVTVDSSRESVEESAAKVLDYLTQVGLIR